MLEIKRTPGPSHDWPGHSRFTDDVLYVTFYDRAGEPIARVDAVRLSELREFTDTWRCGPACDYDPRRLCLDNDHSYSTRRVPAEPTLLDLLGWSA